MTMLEIVTPIVLVYVSGRIYAQFDGDKTLTRRYPRLKRLLHLIHHWQFIFVSFGIAILFQIGYDFGSYSVWLVGVFWLGIGLFLEDFTYHMIHGGWWGEPKKKPPA